MTLARKLLYLLLQIHVGLVSVSYYTRMSECNDSSTHQWYQLFSSDEATLEDRIRDGQDFRAFSVLQLLLMALTVVLGEIRHRGDTTETYYLSPLLIVLLPGTMLVGAFAVRVRHTGMFGCASGDPYCCDNMPFDVTDASNTHVDGCSQAVRINAYNRSAYCALPYWYNTAACTGGLVNTTDLHLYNTYGCSSVYTADEYWYNRIVLIIEVLFAAMAIYVKEKTAKK